MRKGQAGVRGRYDLQRSNVELARQLAEMEKKYDAQFKVIFDAIRELMRPPEKKIKEIKGFEKGRVAE